MEIVERGPEKVGGSCPTRPCRTRTQDDPQNLGIVAGCKLSSTHAASVSQPGAYGDDRINSLYWTPIHVKRQGGHEGMGERLGKVTDGRDSSFGAFLASIKKFFR